MAGSDERGGGAVRGAGREPPGTWRASRPAHGAGPLGDVGAIPAPTPVLPEQGVPSASAPRHQRVCGQMTCRAGARVNLTPASTGPSALVTALETMEEELAIRLIPAGTSLMLLQVSKTMRTAMQRVSPPAMIKVKRDQRTESVKNAMLHMMKWCRITAINLSCTSIQADGVGRLAAVRAMCITCSTGSLREQNRS